MCLLHSFQCHLVHCGQTGKTSQSIPKQSNMQTRNCRSCHPSTCFTGVSIRRRNRRRRRRRSSVTFGDHTKAHSPIPSFAIENPVRKPVPGQQKQLEALAFIPHHFYHPEPSSCSSWSFQSVSKLDSVAILRF